MDFNLKDFLSFDRMLTPVIIKIVYWLGVAAVLAGGLFSFLQGAVAAGLLWIVLGPVLVRVYCELLIVLFNIYNVLRDIRDRSQSL